MASSTISNNGATAASKLPGTAGVVHTDGQWYALSGGSRRTVDLGLWKSLAHNRAHYRDVKRPADCGRYAQDHGTSCDIEYSCPGTQPSLRQGLPHNAGHTHSPCRLFHGFLDTKPYSRHGPARPIRPARTPCNHPTSAAEKPTQPAIHRTASPLWMTTHPSITMPRVRAHQPSDRGTPSIPAPGPTITIRPARPSGIVGPAVWHPFCI